MSHLQRINDAVSYGCATTKFHVGKLGSFYQTTLMTNCCYNLQMRLADLVTAMRNSAPRPARLESPQMPAPGVVAQTKRGRP